MSDQPELPVALGRFAARLPQDHETQLWVGLLRRFHGAEKHVPKEWHALIEKLKIRPVARV